MAEPAERVYHVELRQFPHNMCRFNLELGELRGAILEPWSRERWIEFGERKWSPHQASLTVIEGPRIPFGQLTMGRGWRTAQRQGREVTEELLEALRDEKNKDLDVGFVGAGAQPAGEPGAPGAGDASVPAGGAGAAAGQGADALALALLARIGGERVPLARAWELAAELLPGLAPSGALALAEAALKSLVQGRLVVLQVGADAAAATDVSDTAETERLLAAAASWVGAAGPDSTPAASVWMRRA
jgi:hypothetical protein